MKLLGIATPTPGHETPRTMSQLADQLNVGFHVYRMLIKNEIKSSDIAKQEVTRLVLNEIHNRMADFWGMTFVPKIRDGYRVNAPDLSDDFVSAAAGRFSGRLAEQINDVSDRAFMEGYNAALNKGWDRAVAWQKVADAWGLDPVQMRAWITYYPEEGYHGGIHPEKSQKQLDELLTVRADRISEHEARTIVNLGQQAEWTAKKDEYKNFVKVYHTAEDELVCSVCGPLDGVAVGLNEQFAGFFMPPLHINCRCSVTLLDENSITKRDNHPLRRTGHSAVQVQENPEREKPKKRVPYETPEVVESEFETPKRIKTQTAIKTPAKTAAKTQVKTSVEAPKVKIAEKAQPRFAQAAEAFLRPTSATEWNERQQPRPRLHDRAELYTRAEHEEKMQRRQAARAQQVQEWRTQVRSGVRQRAKPGAVRWAQHQGATRPSSMPRSTNARLGNSPFATVDRRSGRYVIADDPNRQYVSKRLRMKYGLN